MSRQFTTGRVCEKCGKALIWYKTFSGKWAPPLDYDPVSTGMVLIENGDSIEYGGVHEQHHCNHDDVVAYRAVKRSKEAARNEWEGWAQRRTKEVDFANDDAFVRECPKCHSEVREPCRNMSKKGGVVTYTKWPHTERQSQAYQVQHEEDQMRPLRINERAPLDEE